MNTLLAKSLLIAVAAVLLLIDVGASAPGDDEIVGDWFGSLVAAGGQLRLKLQIAADGSQALKAVLVSIDQGGAVIPASKVSRQGSVWYIEFERISGIFVGELGTDAGSPKLAGTWTQNGVALPLTFRRTDQAPPIARPQVPKKPYPYREEAVSFENSKAPAKFAATLTLPPGKGPFPAVVLIKGSGPHDRDETVFDHKPFLILADYLTRRGIATLRYDDRGVGGSTGDRSRATTLDFTDDALAGLAFLTTRPEIDHARIGLVGHSEGATIASIAATKSNDVAFIVMLAGIGVVGEEVLYLQGWKLLERQGASKEAVARERAIQEGSFSAVKQEKDDVAAEKRIREVCRSAGGMTDAAIALTVKQVTSPWLRFFLTLDPRPTLEKVRCPVLALNGGKDTQVTPKENAPAVEAALKAGGNRDCTVRILPGLNHLFQTCNTGMLNEYGQIEETFAPSALQVIGDWILKHAGAGG